ncbi:MAG TPA: HAMP domain-containing sensor histidine kinase, partial [Kofleriaceae bacterium]|nr:HAMP domain-containing sensor histidine kinase [Kofleriaceae bacterium]
IGGLTSFVPRLRDGGAALPPDPVRDEIGELGAAMRDVAERLASARAEQDRLLASAAHELRTPLTVLRTEVDLALRKDRSADELRASLREVRSDLERLGTLAGALLDLQAVRHIGFEREPGDLVQLAREACAGLSVVAQTRSVELRVVADGPAPARFDERTLRQAVDNLIGNALKHTPPHTAVEVSVRRERDRWQLAVADRGPGVEAEHADRIFEPFQRFAAGTGAGLGLAIVREVMARHDGRAWLDLDYRAGARFVVELGP